MPGFVFAIGVLVLLIGSLGGIFIAIESNPIIGFAYIFSSIVFGSCLMGFGKLLEWVKDIRFSLIDETFQITEHHFNGASFRVKAIRSRGKFGGTYQTPDTEPVTVEPKFNSKEELIVYIQNTIQNP